MRVMPKSARAPGGQQGDVGSRSAKDVRTFLAKSLTVVIDIARIVMLNLIEQHHVTLWLWKGQRKS